MSNVALITGAARGIGLELCRLLLARDYTVIACPRRAGGEDLTDLRHGRPDRIHEIEMDVGRDDSVTAAAGTIAKLVERVDLLFNNAGIYPKSEGGLESLDLGSLVDAFEVNAIGPIRVTRALLPLLRKGDDKRLVQITSLMGSMGDNTSGGSYAYRMSKAALNMATRNLAHELGPEGFLAVAIHPGWVRTRMGGSSAPLELESAAEEVLRVATTAARDRNGVFLGPGGKEMPW